MLIRMNPIGCNVPGTVRRRPYYTYCTVVSKLNNDELQLDSKGTHHDHDANLVACRSSLCASCIYT